GGLRVAAGGEEREEACHRQGGGAAPAAGPREPHGPSLPHPSPRSGDRRSGHLKRRPVGARRRSGVRDRCQPAVTSTSSSAPLLARVTTVRSWATLIWMRCPKSSVI